MENLVPKDIWKNPKYAKIMAEFISVGKVIEREGYRVVLRFMPGSIYSGFRLIVEISSLDFAAIIKKDDNFLSSGEIPRIKTVSLKSDESFYDFRFKVCV